MKILTDQPTVAAVLQKEAYCSRLGHFVPLRYCLHPAQDDPCFRIFDCWWQIFDVVSFLRSNLPEEVFTKIASVTCVPNRMEGILNRLSAMKEGGSED